MDRIYFLNRTVFRENKKNSIFQIKIESLIDYYFNPHQFQCHIIRIQVSFNFNFSLLCRIFFFYFITLMDDFTELNYKPLDSINYYLHFFQDESNDSKNYLQKSTTHSDFSQKHNLQEPQVNVKIKNELLESVQQNQEAPLRSRCIIELGEKSKQKYIQSKKGKRKETNDLTVNSKNLLKKLLLQKIPELEENNFWVKEQFQSSKPTLENLKSFFQKISLETNSSHSSESQNSLIKPFIKSWKNQLCHSSAIKKVLLSRKMKFNSKIVLIKYIESLKNSCVYPEKFEKWKSIRHINLNI